MGVGDQATKVCTNCGEEWPVEQFRPHIKGSKGQQLYVSQCRPCESKPRPVPLPVGPRVTDLELEVVEGAACKGSLLHASYAGRGTLKHGPRQTEALLAVCDLCPVRDQCREYGDQLEAAIFRPSDLVNTEPRIVGIFGGETPMMRVLRRKQERGELCPDKAA